MTSKQRSSPRCADSRSGWCGLTTWRTRDRSAKRSSPVARTVGVGLQTHGWCRQHATMHGVPKDA